MYKIIKIIWVVFLWFFISHQTFANTEVSWTISENTTWTLANSPYIVTNSLSLSANYTLTIEPGVVVKVANQKQITINGKLIANGTDSQKIIFTSVNDHSAESGWDNGYGTGSPASGQWRNIRIYNSTSNDSILNNVKIQYASRYDGYPVYLYNTNATISNSLLQYSNWDGIYIYGWNPTLESNTIREFGSHGVRINTWNTTLNNNLIDGYKSATFSNANDSIYIYNGNHTFTNNTITRSIEWVYIWGWYHSFTWNNISNNTSYGVNSPDSEVRNGSNDITKTNTIENNPNWNVIVRSLDIQWSNGVIDASDQELLIMWNGYLANNKTLTFTPGSVIKINNWAIMWSYWKILAQWSQSEKIIFTTTNDHSVWKKDIWDGNPVTANNFRYIILSWNGTDNSVFEHIEVRHWWKTDGFAMYLSNTTDTIVDNAYFHDNTAEWIYIAWGWKATIQNSIFKNNPTRWIRANTWNHNILNNTFDGLIYDSNWVLQSNKVDTAIYSYNDNKIISGNTITNHDSVAIQINNWNPILENNTITNNTNGINIDAWDAQLTGNTISDNSGYGINNHDLEIRIWSKDVAKNNVIENNAAWNIIVRSMNIRTPEWTLDAKDQELILDGNGYLAINKTLTITPGSVIKIYNGHILWSYGKIIAQWLPSDRIIFTTENDHTVWKQDIWDGNPVTGNNFRYIILSWAGSDESIFEYFNVRHGWKTDWFAMYILNSSDSLIKNCIIEKNTSEWIYMTGGNNNTITKCLFKENPTRWLRVNNWNHNILNNTFVGLMYDQYNVLETNKVDNGVYVYAWGSQTIKNNIFHHSDNAWLYSAWWTHTVENNLFYQANPDSNISPLSSSNIVWEDPEFADEYYTISDTSPTIGGADDGGDIWAYSLGETPAWFLQLYTSVALSWIDKTLSYTWDFIQKPSGAGNIDISNKAGTINSDITLQAWYEIKHIWNYTLQFTLLDSGNIVARETHNFEVVK